MFRIIFFALATVAFAQRETTQATREESQGILTGGNSEYRKVVKGDLKTDPANWKSYIELAADNIPQSYWHDVPMFFDEKAKIYNMIVEIPRGDSMKTRMNLGEDMNPIFVAVNSDKLPENENVDYIHNFGKIPQTYNNVSEDQLAKMIGNGRPLDVVEISEFTHAVGDIVQVKILGVLGVVEDNAVNWKLIAFDTKSASASEINNLEDVERLFPDLLQATRGYFRFYKFPGTINEMILNGKFQDANVAHTLLKEKHDQWTQLLKLDSPPEGIITRSHRADGFFKADDAEWRKLLSA